MIKYLKIMTKTKKEQQKEQKEHLSDKRELLLYNDNVNTFDYVINTLIEVCNHEPEQAEQCTLIIHHKGKGVVKSGPLTELEPMHKEFIKRGLVADIN